MTYAGTKLYYIVDYEESEDTFLALQNYMRAIALHIRTVKPKSQALKNDNINLSFKPA